MASTYFDSGNTPSTLDYFKYKDLQVSPQFKPKGGDFTSGDWSYDKEGKFDKTAEDTRKDPLGKSGSGAKWGQALGLASSYLDKAVNKGEKDQTMQKIYNLGDSTKGFGGQLFEGFGAIMPSQHAPIVVPGVQSGSSGKGAGIGRLAGTVLGLGASALIPGVGPMIGATIGGSLGGGVGGLFD